MRKTIKVSQKVHQFLVDMQKYLNAESVGADYTQSGVIEVLAYTSVIVPNGMRKRFIPKNKIEEIRLVKSKRKTDKFDNHEKTNG
jgi:hypothetical protein